MPKRALIEKRPWLLASLIAAIGWYFARGDQLPGVLLIAWKGAGVALLAIYALHQHKSLDSRQIALVMALGALGDVLIEIMLEAGAAAFLIGHLVAIHLYRRHPRKAVTVSQRLTGRALLILTPLIAWQLTTSPLAAIYALALGAMADFAWTSSFPRYRVGIGAVLFVASDLLIFARMGPLSGSSLPDIMIWPLYYSGQFLIATGVVGELTSRKPQG